jgi:hypothetical protein
MRLFHITITAFLLAAISSTAYAEKDPRIKFYDFDEMLIDGEIKKPQGLLLDAHRSAEFKRLNDMRRSFVKELEDTAREKTIK